MTMPRRRALPLVSAALLAGLLAGCTDTLGGLNPFKGPETILAGERRAVLPRAADEVAGGSPSIGGAHALSDWSQPGGNPANAPGHVSLAGGTGATAWSARAVEGFGRRDVRASASPLVLDGRVYVYGAGGVVTALAEGGTKLWTTSLRPEGEKTRVSGGGIAASGGAIYAATGYGELVALDAGSGARQWTYKLDAPARSAPTVANGRVFMVNAASVIHAVNAADGSKAWTSPGVSETAGVLSAASPAVVGNMVVVPYPSGEIVAFDAATGDLKWLDAVVRATRTRAISGLREVAASPVIVDGTVYATGVSGRTIAVRLADGERTWEANLGSASTPAVSGNALFLIDLEDNMVALDRATGKVFWRTALPVVRKKRFFSTWSGPMLAGGALWAVSNDGNLIRVDPASGALASNQKLSKPSYLRPIAANGRLYVLLNDGSVTALN
jgi:outer membrane protein assembly factor BamB